MSNRDAAENRISAKSAVALGNVLLDGQGTAAESVDEKSTTERRRSLSTALSVATSTAS